MRTALASLTLVLALGACATIDEAYGRPDSQDWTYFDGPPEAVVQALEDTFRLSGIRVESIRSEGGGTVVTFASRRGSASVSEVLVQATEVEGFSARAQIYTQSEPLPRWLEMEVTGRI